MKRISYFIMFGIMVFLIGRYNDVISYYEVLGYIYKFIMIYFLLRGVFYNLPDIEETKKEREARLKSRNDYIESRRG